MKKKSESEGIMNYNSWYFEGQKRILANDIQNLFIHFTFKNI